MPSEKIMQILRAPDKEVEQTQDELSRLTRLIMGEINLNHRRWDVLMTRYLDDPLNRVGQNTKDRSTERGNLNKEFFRPRMTWKVFQKFLRFLHPVRVRFEIHLTWANKKTTVHGLNLRVNRYIDDDDVAGVDDIYDETPSP